MTSSLLIEYVAALFGREPARAVALLEGAAGRSAGETRSMLRLALHRPVPSLLHWVKLQNVWTRLGGPMLKPNPVEKRLLLLTDFTAEGLAPAIALASAAYGVKTEVSLPPFDSVEQTILSGPFPEPGPDLVALLLSEEWLRRQLGSSPLVSRERVRATQQRLLDLLSMLRERCGADLLVANFPGPTYASPSGTARTGGLLGWSLAVAQLNAALADLGATRTYVLDLADAIFGVGGRLGLGRASFWRARMAYEPLGAVAVARATAAAVASLAGKSHRALLTDWDNTLWGGEVAEVGASGIVCGPDTADGLAFGRVQQRLRGLKATGVLLGAVSRNDPQVVETLKQNHELTLVPSDFATLQVSWDPKSTGVARAAQDLGFGPEFMVFLDDSLFEIAEVLGAHPDIDVVLAGSDPQSTLERLGESPFFTTVHLVADDLERSERAAALRQQRERSTSFASLEEFLREIRIRLHVSPLSAANAERVVQLLQKSNQFNLTTRRHGRADLELFGQRGGSVWAFAYEDAFGHQGIISVVVLIPEEGALRIDSWVMSCRVLNRTVEFAVFAHILARAGDRRVIGEYIPTERNGLVRGHYDALGFQLVSRREDPPGEVWAYERGAGKAPPPHQVTLVED